MTNQKKHIINKLVIEVNTNSKTVGLKLKDKLDMFLKQDIFPYLENYLESIAPSLQASVIQIPKIDLQIQSSADNNFTELKEILKTSIKKQIKNIISIPIEKNSKATFLTHSESSLQTFLNFLEKGNLPWWSTTSNDNPFKKQTLQSITKTSQFKTLFIEKLAKSQIQIRLINQFTDAQIYKLLKSIFLNKTQTSEEKIGVFNTSKISENHVKSHIFKIKTLKNLGALSKIGRQIVWQIIIEYLISDNNTKFRDCINYKSLKSNALNKEKETIIFKNSLQRILKELDLKMPQKNEGDTTNNKIGNFPQFKANQHKVNTSNFISKNTDDNSKSNNKKYKAKHTSKKASKTAPTNKDSNLKNNNDIWNEIKDNHSYLEQENTTFIVQNAGLILLHPYLNNFFTACHLLNKKGHIKDEELAIHLLHYLATKQQKQFESNMIFEKLLCGIPTKISINRHIKISKKLKNNTEELLKAVITNWGVLKNASPDLLRNEFLKRPGKITFKDNTIKLIVERKTQDILLNKLPWTISFCKLPWLKQIIVTDW